MSGQQLFETLETHTLRHYVALLPQGRIKILIQKLKQFLKDRPLIRGMDCFFTAWSIFFQTNNSRFAQHIGSWPAKADWQMFLPPCEANLASTDALKYLASRHFLRRHCDRRCFSAHCVLYFFSIISSALDNDPGGRRTVQRLTVLALLFQPPTCYPQPRLFKSLSKL